MTEADAIERFTRLYDSYHRRVYAYAVSRAGRQLADEVVSEVFLVAWGKLGEVPDDPLPWLLVVARNVISSEFRASARQQSLAAELRSGTAAAVALATVGAPVGAPGTAAHHPGTAPGAKVSPGTSGSLRTAILTAFNGVSGDILYSRVTESWPHGSSVTDEWAYPLRPSVGQRVRVRDYLVRASDASRFDMELIYRQPADPENSQGAMQISAQRTERIDVEYGNRTWSDQTINAGVMGPGIDPSALRKQIASGQFASVVRTELNGRAVIKLTIRDSGHGTVRVTTLWVDAATYLPLRTVSEGGGYTYEVDSAYLPPTAANLAKLNVAIPAGFTRTPTIELPRG